MTLQELRLKQRAYSKAWRLRHPERYKESTRRQNRLRGKGHWRKYRLKKLATNPTFYADRAREWRSKNKERSNTIFRRYKLKRYQTDPNFRLRVLLSGSIQKAVRKNGTFRIAKTMELIGTDIQTLRHYLEAKFKLGMTWENMGKSGWHIDHVKPKSSFDLSLESEQRTCFHYSNLQPLWWWENLEKGVK